MNKEWSEFIKTMQAPDQVTESLITNAFEEGTTAQNFAYQQFFTAL